MKTLPIARPHRLATTLRAALAVLALGSTSWVCAQAAEGVVFRSPEGALLSPVNSALPPSADAGWWRESRGLPIGSRIELATSAAQAPADGHASLRLDISLFDAAGKPIDAPTRLLLETSLGRLQLPPPADGSGAAEPELASVEILTRSGRATVWLRAPASPGTAQVRVSSGAVGVQGNVVFVPDLRPLLAIGVVEGAIQFGKRQRDALTPEIGDTGFEEHLRRWESSSADGDRQFGGRAAFYLKGTIRGDLLLTAAADSDKPTQQKLFRDIDPNQFYPVYGDASVREFDAQSQGRLFVRIDKDRSYALYGDFQTASDNPAQVLAAYPRSLNGVRFHHETDGVRVNAFASHDRTRQFVDEQAGRGISGPYAIGRANATANSEQVEILVRDRAQPALVLKRTRLTRFVDYDFEPFSGRVLFRQPVPSVDENLNPVSIRMAYEVDDGGQRFWVSGADGKVRINEALSLGAAYAQDDNPLAPYRLGGVNAELALAPRTSVVAEVAATRGSTLYNQTIDTPVGGSAAAGDGQSGNAARIELRHNGEDLQVRAVAARAGAGFQNSHAGLAPGREERGLRASQAVNPDLRVVGELSQTQDRSGTATDGAARRSASAGVEWKLDERLRLDLSVNDVRERQVAGSGGILSAVDAQSAGSSVGGLGSSLGTSFGFNGTGLLASPVALAPAASQPPALVDRDYTSLRARLTGRVTPDFSLFGEHEVADRDRQRSALGAEYRFDEKSRAYARQEFANSLTGSSGLTTDGSRTRATVIGMDTAYMRDGQLFSEYRLAGGQNGQDAAAAIGVRNLWKLSDGLSANTLAERQSVRPAAGGALDATALALSVEYTGNALYRIGGKLEWRDSSAQDSTLASLGYDRKLARDWTALVRALQMDSRGRGLAAGNDDTQRRSQLGLAYRDTTTNVWHGLARLEQRADIHQRVDSAAGNTNLQDSRTWIGSLHANVKRSRAWTHSGQVAFKSVNETVGADAPAPARWRGALLAGRTVWDFAERWDASLFASAQQGNGTRLRGVGSEVGYRVMNNLWLSAGWTQGRYSDVDLFSANSSWSGAHIRLRFKFDEKLFGADDPRRNRALAEVDPPGAARP